ncbi:hypothetical protein [Haloarchaeobius sp. HME9146]|uniref:hypothetical protein n=1 Tax=Haloarchaeobius sp. HME9146 TaxID=2978732 RepID=UPI0021BE41B2|nr:hypothetical protein [Haloarchaeobius sp. HME9146]MCT9096786.1 hypothetical protein [Haloarchaeobius sp. HME9146]
MKTNLSRRQVLAGLGTIGVASAGAGLGTTAFYSDREALEGWLEAGRVDLRLDYRSTYKPWERYDLHNVPLEARPPIVAGTDGMAYEIAAAPAIRNVDTGEAPTHEQWGRLVSGETDVPAACVPDDARDISQYLPEGFRTENSGTLEEPGVYYPGYVDGPTGMFVMLDDIKPYDEGETTFSLHLCGNPSYITASLADMLDLEDEDGTENPIEPELEAGEPGAGDRSEDEMAVWDGGELADYLYVVVSTDSDCDNLTANTIFGAPDEDDLNFEDGISLDPDFDIIDENILYAGSLAGWKQLLEAGYELPPSGAGGVGTNGMQPGVVTPVIQPANGSSVEATYQGDFTGGPGGQINQCISHLPEECEDAELTGLVSGLSGFCYDGEIPEGTTHVVLKAGIGCYLAEVDEGTTEICLVDPELNPNQFGEISNATFFQCFEDEFDPDPEGDPEPGDCFVPGAHCYAMEWYLPCKENDPTRLGFTDLPVYNAIDQDGNPIEEQDMDTDGQAGESRLSFNDELRQRGFVDGDATIDVNVTQTDSCHFTIEFEAVQCRHNMRPVEEEEVPVEPIDIE